MTPPFELTPFTASALFIAAALAGYQYRVAWKTEAAAWKLWVYGVIAAMCFLALGFTPMRVE